MAGDTEKADFRDEGSFREIASSFYSDGLLGFCSVSRTDAAGTIRLLSLSAPFR
ncbi:hypothetical protein Rcae01_05491 [Novipirellula caenicola]|uniref:Uncharacterized protein n=1 Tax=Novipirellula caenicola TaxID=1536901 RepID=A0ABP9VY08_9BACT